MVSGTTSYAVGSSAAATPAAEANDTSCSQFCPPPMTATRVVTGRSSAGAPRASSSRPGRPMPVTISCSSVPAHSAQSATVGSPVVAGAEDGDRLAHLATGRAEIDDRLVHRDPADHRHAAPPRCATSARPEAARGNPSAYPSGTSPR